MEPVYLSNKEIAQLMKLKTRGLNEKEERQGWPFKKVSKASGRAPKIFEVATLPDDIQIAWTKEIVKKRSVEKLRYAKSLPVRITYYAEDPPKRYDGKSRGLCKEAAQILSSVNLETLANEENDPTPTALLIHARFPSRICPECGYGEYKEELEKEELEKEEQKPEATAERSEEEKKNTADQSPNNEENEQKKEENSTSVKHCLHCGTKLIDSCPTCGEELCLPDQNFCSQGHQLRNDRAIPEYAKRK